MAIIHSYTTVKHRLTDVANINTGNDLNEFNGTHKIEEREKMTH